MRLIYRRFLFFSSLFLSLLFSLGFPSFTTALNFFEVNSQMAQQAQKMQQNYQKQLQDYQDLKTTFLNLRQRWQKNPRLINEDFFRQRAQTYFNQSLQTMISYLEASKTRVENNSALSSEEKSQIINEIDDSIKYLQELESELKQDQNLSSLRKTVSKLRQYWQERRVRSRRWACRLMTAKGEKIVQHLEGAEKELKKTIAELKAEGVDVKELEALLQQAEQDLEQTKSKLKTIRERCQNISTLSEARSVFSQTQQELRSLQSEFRRLHRQLRTIIKKLKEKHHPRQKIRGQGAITIQGQGKAAFIGQIDQWQGTVDQGGQGVAIIIDQGGDAVINTQGQGQKTVLGENKTKYQGLGQLSVEGTKVVLIVQGNNLQITATGKGTVLLKGEGSFQIEGQKEQSITPGNVEIKLN